MATGHPPNQIDEDAPITSAADEKDPTPESERADIVALFRLLMREPPKDHDFRTCPVCERHGITSI